MESLEQPKKIVPTLEVAGEEDIATLIAIEKSIGTTNTYSSMLEPEEWEEELKSNSVFLLKDEGSVIGSLAYEQKSPDHLYISGVVVRPEYQGRGVAKAALQKVLSDHPGMKRIDLVTHPDNPALELYKSLGFKVESRQENYWGEGEPRLVLVFNNDA